MSRSLAKRKMEASLNIIFIIIILNITNVIFSIWIITNIIIIILIIINVIMIIIMTIATVFVITLSSTEIIKIIMITLIMPITLIIMIVMFIMKISAGKYGAKIIRQPKRERDGTPHIKVGNKAIIVLFIKNLIKVLTEGQPARGFYSYENVITFGMFGLVCNWQDIYISD